MGSPSFCKAVFLIFCLVGAIFAQESINNASIGGRVLDQSGATVENARVSARDVETNLSSSVTTDREGRFRFPYLKVGRYEVTARKAGFDDQRRNLTLTIGSAFELPISLGVASAATAVTVTGDATILEAARSQVAGTVSKTEIQEPSNGRSFLDAALLIPGVSPTNTAANQDFRRNGRCSRARNLDR